MRRFHAFAALVASAVLVSCHEAPTAPVRAPQPDLLGNLLSGLVACAPLPYDSATAVIGPDGGTIQVGPHSLTIPAGALDSDVTITAAIVAGSQNAVRFGPEGLQFVEKPTLRLSYANCGLVGLLLPKHIAY